MKRLRSLSFFLAGAISSLVLLLAVPLFSLEDARAVPTSYNPYRKLNLFAKVLTYIENSYVESVDDTQLIYGAIKGMMDTLDTHSAFLNPEMNRQMKSETQGEFGGLGIEVEIRNEWLVVVAPLEGTPAAKAGLRTGDEIRSIDGKSTQRMGMHEAVQIMRGPRGTRVKISVHRPGAKELLHLELVRDIIKIQSVQSQVLEPGIGHIKLKTFQERADQQLHKEVKRLLEKGPLRGLILDLRNNPGGLLDQAVRVADLFLESGVIVKTVGKGGKVMEEEKAHSRGTFSGFPMICLVNGGAASASEIVAGALQDHRRAVVMGTRTFGKGSVQTLIDLDDGSGLKLTVARYFTPNGRSIQERGIEPDILVPERAPATLKESAKREKDLERHLLSNAPREKQKEKVDLKDFQLQTALDYLRAAEILRQGGG